MSNRRSPAFAFWLDYLDSRGGLWEQSGDSVLTVLSDHLATMHDLPESTLITDDPDIAREDGVLFLGAGHPEIHKAADAVIATGDVAALTLPHPAKPISAQDLLTRIRDQIPVDHGRIDATGAPIRTHRPMLRLGVLVSHTVSADEQFTEVAECLIDVTSRIPWPEDSAAQIRDAVATGASAGPDVRTNDLVAALAVAHQILDEAATVRGRTLAAGADAERTAEIARAKDYYAAALEAIDKRRVGADPDRTALLDARAQATVSERDRRLAEINEKYEQRHALRPFRLHLIDLPAWRLTTDVRRGDRRWPLTVDYLPLLGTVAPLRCPTCDTHAPLVATKTNLACTNCAPTKTSLHSVSAAPKAPAPKPTASDPGKAPKPTASSPGKAPKAVPSSPGKASKPAASDPGKAPKAIPTGGEPRSRQPQKTRPVQENAPKKAISPATPTRPVLPGKAEERKVIDFWHHVAAGSRRRLVRLIAPGSPLAALIRVYGPSGVLYGIGVPPGHTPTTFTCANYDQPVVGGRGGTAGTLDTSHDQYRFLLLWSPDLLLEEILPYSAPWHPGRFSRLLRPPDTAPPPQADLDRVAQLLAARTTARLGLTFTARALAAWWRLPDHEALLARFTPQVLAAAVDRAVRYWSGANGATYPDAAKTFGADENAIRKATPILQKHLQLSTTRNW